MTTLDDVEAFCTDNCLDEQATTQLKELDEEMQREILGRGPLTDARNPSAVLLSRIRQLKQGGGGSKGGGGGFGGRKDRASFDRDVEAFIRDNDLDDRASACLRESDADILTELFARGPLTGARNASAMLLSRIRAIKDDLAAGRGGKSRRGDGGYGRGDGGKGKGRGERSGGGGGREALNREVEAFCKDNDLDHRASDCLRECDDDLLTELFARGPLTGARNPSAMVLSRIRAIKDDIASGKVGKSSRRGDGGYGRDDKGKGKGKGDDWWSWFMPPPWMMWGGKGDWDSWGKGAWDSWGKGDGQGKGGWDEGKGKGEDGGKGRAAPY